MQTNKIETMPINKLIFNMSLPMIISLLIQSLYNMVDSMFVAKLSEDALTATSLAFPVQMIMIAVGVGSAVGLNALLSKTLGKKDYHEASMVAMSGIALAIIHSLIFTIIGLLWTERMAMSFTDNVAIAQMCTEYLWICIVFCLGNLVCMTFQRILQASGNTFLSMMVLGSGAVTNIILDPILIFGLNGYFAFGIRGAALATVIGQWVSMIVGLFLCLKKNKDVNLTFQGFTLQIKRIIEIYKVGFPTIVMQSLNGLMVTVINSILLPFSTTAVAFFGVYYKLQNIV
ncbi:MAG: MATE family efflux transporter, partial [Traorella sp.]